MNAISRLFFLTFLVLFGVSAAVADDGVVGMWSSSSRTKGSLGPQWVFAKDGSVSHTFGAIADFRYEINGNQVRTTILSTERALSTGGTTQEFSIDGDTLIENPQAPDQKIVMTRTGKPYEGAHPIVGEWRYTHYTGVPALMRYSRHGVAQLSVPAKTLTGTYRMNQDTLTVMLKDQPPVEYKFRREKGLLILSNARGKESKYVGFEY